MRSDRDKLPGIERPFTTFTEPDTSQSKMKPPPFDYYDPTSIEEAVDLLQRYGDEAKVLAGGQSLMPLLNFRLTYPAALIDINRNMAKAQFGEG